MAKQRYIQIPLRVWRELERGKIRAVDVGIYACLDNHRTWDHPGRDWTQLSLSRIVTETGLGLNTVKRGMKRLLAAGVIQRGKTRRTQIARYKLIFTVHNGDSNRGTRATGDLVSAEKGSLSGELGPRWTQTRATVGHMHKQTNTEEQALRDKTNNQEEGSVQVGVSSGEDFGAPPTPIDHVWEQLKAEAAAQVEPDKAKIAELEAQIAEEKARAARAKANGLKPANYAAAMMAVAWLKAGKSQPEVEAELEHEGIDPSTIKWPKRLS